ncbi:HIT domain-containing protein [Mycolicibacterium sp. 120266]|uniref:HIT family protein n=1 Tax=Mycolicibacterium sp. 120266 TaxID=3090601 RepID=UPI00299DEDC9|nr:HIT domain-containing protein [Mycolicibacterium sp. 120266]MDX1873413.1 HIT domain-containing protein [Mycolicibacterium sp. 120266]
MQTHDAPTPAASIPAVNQDGCPVCKFALWMPVAKLSVSRVGLYDDARFPGRLIVSLDEHYEHFDQVEPGLLSAFMADLKVASLVLRKMSNVDRVNIAVLGNKDPHVHAHVIPRRFDDVNHGVSPWEGAPPHAKLSAADRIMYIDMLRQGFESVDQQIV